MSTLALTVPSFAKINWSLRILGRRPDGHHEIQTLLQTVSLCDELRFALRPDRDVTLSCNDPLIPVDDSNLIIRAAAVLRHRFKITRGVDIRLEKRIPAKGGLGGASSNGAMAMLALDRLWNLKMELSELIEIGATLGADVPFFLVGGQALATGTGTDLRSLRNDNRASKHLLIVTPRAVVATLDAYRSLRAPALTSNSDDSILSSSRVDDILRATDPYMLHNDFEDVIFKSEPEIERVKKALNAVGARGSLLAGSGSSVFGIFENEYSQGRAAQALRTEIGWRIFAAVTISRQEYLQALGPCGVTLSGTNSKT